MMIIWNRPTYEKTLYPLKPNGGVFASPLFNALEPRGLESKIAVPVIHFSEKKSIFDIRRFHARESSRRLMHCCISRLSTLKNLRVERETAGERRSA